MTLDFKYYYRLSTYKYKEIASWIHACLEVDLTKKEVLFTTANIKREKVNNVDKLQANLKLNMQLGIVNNSYDAKLYPFFGKVTNLNIFDLRKTNGSKLIQNFLKNPCIKGDFMSWDKMKWKIEGDGINMAEIDDRRKETQSQLIQKGNECGNTLRQMEILVVIYGWQNLTMMIALIVRSGSASHRPNSDFPEFS